MSLGGGGGTPEWTSKMVIFALAMLFLIPTCISVFAPSHMAGSYDEQIAKLEDEYYLTTGIRPTPTTEVWGLVGIYTPYIAGHPYGYTADGWIYSDKVVEYEASQYPDGSSGHSKVELMDNGLYYYTAVAPDDLTHTAATRTADGWDYSEASLYTAVTMDNDHKSTVWFSTGNRGETSDGFYYDYTGYRYAFGPLRTYETDVGGVVTEVRPGSTTLSLIWYQYASYSGISGQLSISGSDTGVSYLSASDILRAFDSHTYSSTFDMTFNNVAMHLTIRLDPTKVSAGVSVQDCYNLGFWSVIVSSDSLSSGSVGDKSYDLSVDNLLNVLVSLFTFNVAKDYGIDGWIGTIASLGITMPFYAILIALSLEYTPLLILTGILAAIQAGLSWWPF